MAKQLPTKATVAGHQGTWVPFGKSMVCSEVWSGDKVPSQAWRVWWWLNNAMTGTVKIEDDPNTYGVVRGSTPVSFKTIATDLHCSWSSVQRAVKWLESKDMITCSRVGTGQQYVYNVLNSIRQFEVCMIEKTKDDEQVSDEFHSDDDEVA